MRIYRGAWPSLVISQLFALAAATFILLIPTQVSRIINLGIYQNNLGAVVDSSLLMLLFAGLAGFCLFMTLTYAVLFAEGTGNFLRTRTYERVQSLSFKNLDGIPIGEMLARLTNDISQINQAVQLSVRFLLYSAFMIVVALILVLLGSPSLVWILVVVIPATAVVLGGVAIVLQKLYKVRQQRVGELNRTLQEDFAGIRVVKSFVRQDYERERFDRANTALQEASTAPMRNTAIIIPSVFLILGVANGLAIWFGGADVLAGRVQVGELVAFSQYIMIILGQMIVLSVVFPQITAAEASAARLAQILDTPADVKDKDDAKPIEISRIQGRVAFEDVSFSYSGDGTSNLEGINLIIEPGETVALLGSTGAGKTTLINLLPRFYDVTSGRVTIDGIDVRDFPQEQLREIVVTALQKAVLFSGTVGGNINFGRPEASMDEAMDAAKVSDAHGFISAIPEGYDAKVARLGANFSGGQRQRLSIARAVVTQPRVLILDDSTSAVDVATESRIQGAMDSKLAGTTKLIIAQRISTVLTADRIVLIDGGKIVAEGSHKQLMVTSPLYREIFDSQLGGLRREDVA
ncbi:MAG: ABC transporter ATP-binding protein [Methanomassiliicoccus sp.]|nr:ABC transporter ATP-binding protein [Methanomassiliicoccus sp.]